MEKVINGSLCEKMNEETAEFNARKNELEAWTEEAYNRRCNFVEALRPEALGDKFYMRLCARLAVVSAMFGCRIDYEDASFALEMHDLTLPDGNYVSDGKPETCGAMYSGVKDDPTLVLRMALYALGDTFDNGYFLPNIYSAKFLHKDNPKLDLIYETLEELGYTMTDWERQLKDGTHPLFADNQK